MASVSVTISVQEEVLEFADRVARERQTSRSSVINAMLAEQMQRHHAEEMAQAYQDWNDENEEIAIAMRPRAVEQLASIPYDA